MNTDINTYQLFSSFPLFSTFASFVTCYFLFKNVNSIYITNMTEYLNELIYYYDKWVSKHFSIVDDLEENETLNETNKSNETNNINTNEQNKSNQLYEEKYLEEIKQMFDTFSFNEDELQLQNIKFKEFYETIIPNKYTEKINELEQEILRLNDDTDDEWDDDTLKDVYKCQINKKIEELKNNIEKLKTSKDDCDNIKQQATNLAYNYVISQKISSLANCFVVEYTPLGNVLMFYNKDGFQYYSNNTIPYRYLEVVARKYVKTFKCVYLYVDMNKELESYSKKVQKEYEENEIKQKQEQTPNKKNVFAKFKNYNLNKSSLQISNSQTTTNNSTNNSQNSVTNKNIVLKEKINRYTYSGKLVNFSILKKIDRKKIDKKYAMSFSDFKKAKIKTNGNVI